MEYIYSLYTLKRIDKYTKAMAMCKRGAEEASLRIVIKAKEKPYNGWKKLGNHKTILKQLYDHIKCWRGKILIRTIR